MERYRNMEEERLRWESRERLKWRNRTGKGQRVDRSPKQEQDVRGIRRSVEETDLGNIFGSISKVMRREMEAVVGRTPRLMQEPMKEGMDVLVRAVEETMQSISEREKEEGRERREKERRREDHLDRIEERLQRLESMSVAVVAEIEKKAEVGLAEVKDKIKEVEGRIVGAVQVESRVKELEEKAAEEKAAEEKAAEEKAAEEMEKVEEKEQPGAAVEGMLMDQIGKMRMKESVKEMEGKVRAAMCGVKVGNFNIGLVTEDKALIVRKVLGEVKKAVRNEEAGKLDSVLKGTRVVVLGKRTEERREGGGPYSRSPSFYSARTGRTHRNWKGR